MYLLAVRVRVQRLRQAPEKLRDQILVEGIASCCNLKENIASLTNGRSLHLHLAEKKDGLFHMLHVHVRCHQLICRWNHNISCVNVSD